MLRGVKYNCLNSTHDVQVKCIPFWYEPGLMSAQSHLLTVTTVGRLGPDSHKPTALRGA
jgi:hypothetical protein